MPPSQQQQQQQQQQKPTPNTFGSDLWIRNPQQQQRVRLIPYYTYNPNHQHQSDIRSNPNANTNMNSAPHPAAVSSRGSKTSRIMMSIRDGRGDALLILPLLGGVEVGFLKFWGGGMFFSYVS